MTISAGSRFGPYEVVAPLGAGGMGEVYRARDPRLGREVALKVLPEEVSKISDRLARFEQEARAASALNHPNIVTIYEIGDSAGSPFIAMELVDGRTLREIVAEGALPLRRILSIGAQAADGLARAHAAGIVHRDLKPENLMVTRDGFVKILDFGLSKLVAPTSGDFSAMPTLARPETHPGTLLGTVAYMSPEQASGRELDFRSDQFSLGSILYEMASGRKAFQNASAAETMSAIIREEPEPLSAVNPKLPQHLRWIIERCLAKDPEERYASTRDLARDLAGLRDHVSEATSGIEIAPGSISAPRRGRRQAIAAAALVALGLVGAAVLWRVLPARSASSPPRFQQVTFRRGAINNARFSPDGQTVFYGAQWSGEKQRLYGVRPGSPESWAVDMGGGSWDILGVSPSGDLAVRTDAREMLARVPIAGGIPRDVVAGVPYASADWAPDGKSLAIVRQAGDRNRLEYPIGTVLLESTDGLALPRISARGDRISYARGIGWEVTLNVMELPGKQTRKISGGWSDVSGVPCWSPDGREIWFAGQRPGEGHAIHAVDLSGKVRLVTRAPGQLELYDISRDGRLLAAQHTNIWVLMGRMAGEDRDRDLSWLDMSRPVDLSTDGKTLLIYESGEGAGPSPAVYLRKTDGSAAVRLGEGRPMALSPDGSLVLASLEPPGAVPHLILLPTGSGEARTLPNDRFAGFGTAQWLPDGRSFVFFAEEKGHLVRLYRMDVQSGKVQPISPEGFNPQFSGSRSLSPDGRSIIGSSAGKASILPIDGGDPRPIAGLNPGDRPIGWTADGRLLYVVRYGESPLKVWLVDPVSAQRRLFKEVVSAEPTESIPRFLITPDGQSYVYGFTRTFSNLYVIEGLR